MKTRLCLCIGVILAFVFPASSWAAVTLTATPDNLSLSGGAGDPTAAFDFFDLSASGSGTINYSIHTNQPWLSTDHSGGSISAGQTISGIKVSANSSQLAPGTYTGTVTITGTGGTAAVTVAVTFLVTGVDIALSPGGISVSLAADSQQSQQITIIVSGGSVNVNLASSQSWLTVSSSQVAAPAQFSITVNTTGLSPGARSASITATCFGGSPCVPRQVQVSLTVQAPGPSLAAPSLTSLSFTSAVGGGFPAPQTVRITSAGADVGITAATSTLNGITWLQAVLNSATTPATLTVSVTPGTLAAGTYGGTVTIIPTSNTGNIAISVSLVVSVPLLSQVADGGGWKTTFILVNRDTVPASVNLQFWKDDASAFPLAFEGIAGASPSLQDIIPVGGSRTFETLGTDSTTTQGWARLTTAQSVGGLAIFRQRVAGRPDEEAAVSVTNTAQRFLLPFDNTAGFVTSMAIVNSSQTQSSTGQASARREDGQALTTGSINLLPQHHTAFALSTPFPALANQRGVLEFNSSDGYLSALGLRFNGVAFTSFPALVPAAQKASSQFLSQIADGNGWKTTIILVNLDKASASYTLHFWKDDGSAFPLLFEGGGAASQTLTGTLPPGGSQSILTTGTAASLSQGWAELTTDKQIGGLAVFRQRVADTPDQEAAVSITSGTSRFLLPFDNTQGFVTSMALMNTNATQPVTVGVTLRDENGLVISTHTIQLGPRNHTAFALPIQFGPSANRRGVAEFSTSTPDITGLGLRFSGAAFTSFPVFGQ